MNQKKKNQKKNQINPPDSWKNSKEIVNQNFYFAIARNSTFTVLFQKG